MRDAPQHAKAEVTAEVSRFSAKIEDPDRAAIRALFTLNYFFWQQLSVQPFWQQV